MHGVASLVPTSLGTRLYGVASMEDSQLATMMTIYSADEVFPEFSASSTENLQTTPGWWYHKLTCKIMVHRSLARNDE